MSRELTDKYKRIPVSDAIEPPSGFCEVYKNYWWCVTPSDEILMYKGTSPQCNINRQIVDHLMPEGCTARQLPVVFIKRSPHDYA